LATSTTPTLSAAIDVLDARTRGDIIQPGSEGYDQARRVYNQMIDRRPAVILRCQDAADVIAGVSFARDHGLDLSVRSGGHNVAGFGTNDDGIVLDLSAMNDVRIDPRHRVAHVGGGATFGDLDHAAWAFGLATPGGVISTTGVAGLGLGGGFGHLTRKFGLVIDNMLAVDVVTADGQLVRASADENRDLFWAIRGGGGNFGVITALEMRLHEVPSIYGGPIFYPASESEQVMTFYREFMASAPRDLNAFFAFHIAPPAPFVPEHLHGHTACAIVVAWTGPLDQAAEALRPIREAGPVALDLAGPIPYPALNSMFDDLLPPGLNHYWKADFVSELTDEAIALHTEHGPQVPTVQSLMHLYPLDGAVHDVESADTAFSHRDVKFVHIIAGVDADYGNMRAHKDWVRSYWSALHPHSLAGGYVNFLMNEGEDRIRATFDRTTTACRRSRAPGTQATCST
jgi:hypothetical protein